MNKKKKIPALRFPEFQNSGEWEDIKLGDCLSYLQPTPYLVESTNYSEDKGVPVLTAGKSFVLGYTDEEKGIFRDKLPVIIFDDFTTASQFVNFPFKVKSSAIKILLAQKKYDIKFVFESMQILRYEVGVHKRHWISVYSKKQIAIPSLPEQQKIADCLSSLDDLIDNHSEKLALLEKHKKGLMQKLFPKEGQKVPELRFPEFQNSGEWEEKKLGGVYDFKSTNSLSRECLNYEKGTVKNIHYGDIHTKFNVLFDITKEHVPFIRQNISIKIKKENYCIEGDIIFADASEDLKDVGKSMEIINLNNEKLVSGLHTLLARQRNNKLIIGFGGYLFSSEFVRIQIQREAQGAKVLGISAKRVLNIKISYPRDKKEQQKIADCLSSLDNLITSEREKIKQLKQHKKGLMQGLFVN